MLSLALLYNAASGAADAERSTVKSRVLVNLHIISKRDVVLSCTSFRARQSFWERYPDSETALLRWYKIVELSDYQNFAELHVTFPSADLVNELVVFTIGGNKYRLIASIHFNRGKVYIRHVLTHQEYDRGAWKE